MKKRVFSVIIGVSCISLLMSNVFAASGSKYLFTGGFPAAKVQDLRYVLSGGDSSYQTNIMSAAANSWNGKSSKVKLSKNSTGTSVSIIKTSQTITKGVVGLSCMYYKDANGNLVIDDYGTSVWYCADVFGFDNQMVLLGYTDNAKKKSVFTHEVGHILSLKHNDSVVPLIMNQNGDNFIKAGVPKADDIANLRLKWGT